MQMMMMMQMKMMFKVIKGKGKKRPNLELGAVKKKLLKMGPRRLWRL